MSGLDACGPVIVAQDWSIVDPPAIHPEGPSRIVAGVIDETAYLAG